MQKQENIINIPKTGLIKRERERERERERISHELDVDSVEDDVGIFLVVSTLIEMAWQIKRFNYFFDILNGP